MFMEIRHLWLSLFQESRIYAVAKSGMRVSEASAGAKGAGGIFMLIMYCSLPESCSCGNECHSICCVCVSYSVQPVPIPCSWSVYSPDV